MLNFARHQHEGLLDILAVLRGGLHEAHVVVVGELLALLEAYLSGRLQIALVADQDARYVLTCVFLHFGHPSLNIGEALSVSNVVNYNDAVGALVIAGGDGLEAFLAGSVPNLELNLFRVNIDSLDLEVHTNCGHEVVCEHVFRKTNQKGRFTDTRVTNQQNLEQVVATITQTK